MAWLIGDGFDFSINGSFIIPGNIWASQKGMGGYATGRFSGSLATQSGNFTDFTTVTFANSTTVYINFAMNCATLYTFPDPTSSFSFFGLNFMDGTHCQCSLMFSFDQHLKIGASILNTGTHPAVIADSGVVPLFSKNVWNHYQVKMVFDASAGSAEIRMNGSSDPTLLATGLNTRRGSTNNYINNINFGFYDAFAFNTLWDDFYVFNDQGAAPNTWEGDVRAIPLMPNADLSTTWTPNSGATNFSRVNEIPCNSDTSYVFTNTPGNEDQYTISPFPSPTLAIVATQNKMIAREDDAGPHQTLIKMVSGGTTVTGASGPALSSTYTQRIDTYTTDPNTSAAWTQAGIEALKIGPVDIV